MKLIDQVITLEQAKRLKELGVSQQSVACFIGDELHLFEKSFYNWAEQKGMNAVAAYTVAELGVMLGTEEWSTNYKKQNIFYWDAELFALPFGAYPTEAEARAHLLLHLIEGNYITIEEVNKGLCAE